MCENVGKLESIFTNKLLFTTTTLTKTTLTQVSRLLNALLGYNGFKISLKSHFNSVFFVNESIHSLNFGKF